MINYFEVLRVSENAEMEVIRASYKALCKKYHPDSTDFPKELAAENMALINEAYEVLSDEEKRQSYVKKLHETTNCAESAVTTNSGHMKETRTKKKKPFYKKLWFWICVIVFLWWPDEENKTTDGSSSGNDYNVVVSQTNENTKEDKPKLDIIQNNNENLDSEKIFITEVDSTNVSVYSMEYLNQYIEINEIEFPKERYKSKLEKALYDDSEMIAVEVSGSEKIRYSATVKNGEFYYVGELKNNVPAGWGKIIRIVTAYEVEYDGHISANINPIAQGWTSGDDLVPLLVYVGEFEDGYYSGYGWKYVDPFENKSYYEREIGEDYAKSSDNIMENILANCNPIEYMGEFDKSMYAGDGILISYGAREIPYYMTDQEQIELLGVVADKEIEFYVGEFRKNKLRGKAKHYLLGKLHYDGEYYDWNYDGTGTLYYLGTNQKKYVGEWENDKYHGKGTLYNEDGSVKYKGKWENGDYAN